jgi:hypothetical protein
LSIEEKQKLNSVLQQEKTPPELKQPAQLLAEVEKLEKKLKRVPGSDTSKIFVEKVEKVFASLRTDLPLSLHIPQSMLPILENPGATTRLLDSIYFDGIETFLDKAKDKSKLANSLLNKLTLHALESPLNDPTKLVKDALDEAKNTGEEFAKELKGKSIRFSDGARSSYWADPAFFPREFVKALHSSRFFGMCFPHKEQCICDIIPGNCDRGRAISWEEDANTETQTKSETDISIWGLMKSSKFLGALRAFEEQRERAAQAERDFYAQKS